MMFLAGVAVGGLVSGIISDKYGRKKTLLASILVQCTLGNHAAPIPITITLAINLQAQWSLLPLGMSCTWCSDACWASFLSLWSSAASFWPSNSWVATGGPSRAFRICFQWLLDIAPFLAWPTCWTIGGTCSWPCLCLVLCFSSHGE